jgi:hypothetical protein
VAEDEPQLDLGKLREQLAALDVGDLLASSASTIASLAFAKIEHRQLEQAKTAIDALGSLMPHVEGAVAAELQQALTELQVAYATAAAA